MEDMRLMIADTNKVCFATDCQGHTVATVPQHSGVLCCSSALCRSGAPFAVSTLTLDNSVATCILASPRLASPRLVSVHFALVFTLQYLLMTTFGVSFLHLAFDILAFKNDVSFWRNVRLSCRLRRPRSAVLATCLPAK